MRVVLDACVLFPSVLRNILLGLADQGLFEPLWSARILEEWARAAQKRGAETEARLAIAKMTALFPKAMVPPQTALETRLVLPDPNDVHVLAIAIKGSADIILTFNARDFPKHVLAHEGLARRDPDGFVWELWSHHPQKVQDTVHDVWQTAQAIAQQDINLYALLKGIKLNRFAKAFC